LEDGTRVPLDFPIELNETEYNLLTEETKKKIGKPMRSSSGGKAYKVYVRDPKTKKIKTVRFGSGGLKAKINNPKHVKHFQNDIIVLKKKIEQKLHTGAAVYPVMQNY
jgi:hypothetical protein